MLSFHSTQGLERLLRRMPAEAFAARCVRPVQRYLSHIVLSGRLGAARLEVMMVGVLLDVMRQANDDGGGIIPYTEFYNEVRAKRPHSWLETGQAARPLLLGNFRLRHWARRTKRNLPTSSGP